MVLLDPKILILDEAKSSVDPESEMAIQAALAEVVARRTTITIAHRLSTLRNAGRILVADNGNIVEEGPHQELIEKGGLYARLVKIQGQMTMPTVEHLSLGSEDEEQLPCREESPLPHPLSHNPRWLDPSFTQIHQDEIGTMHVQIDHESEY